ncbi:Serine/Threonine kinase domain protein (macronuclear) [Tetrahymena thermophila SB210]|uniref:Serine/Threonine kinase domain protein n=1 Tax=Tetrahymena thermophila (strain SB210) TaxID=312017 RepID=Q23JZ3_TETTS|nr:Serine/Threonine kinase domain protein [Tetrahymena thermophila SB210]EAR97050.2 Serine/Threonine kinase domain protein [Tetrahymena thermophila SB210]|eukprot:XP_001017295.2 Serine/Threonine kinase domain protein [Tetrahymena thermophila SB210]
MNKLKLGTSQSASVLNDSSQQNRFNGISPILERKQNKSITDKALAFEEDRIQKINSVYNKQLIAKKMNKIMNERSRETDLNRGLLVSADFKVNNPNGFTVSSSDTVEIKSIIKNLKEEGTLPRVKKFDEDLKFTKSNQQFNNITATEHKPQFSQMSNPYAKNIQDFKKMKSVQQQNIQKINDNIQRLAMLQDNLKKGNLEFLGNTNNRQPSAKQNNIVPVASEKSIRQEKNMNQQNLNQHQLFSQQQNHQNQQQLYYQQSSQNISNQNQLNASIQQSLLPQLSYKKYPSEIIKPYLSKQNLKVQINKQKAAVLINNVNQLENKIRCQSSTFIPFPKDGYLQQFQKDLQKQNPNQKKSYQSPNNAIKGDQLNFKNNFKEIIALSEEETKLYGSRCPQGYEKIEILGKGGFSVVWLCKSSKTQQKVAVKQIVNKNNQESIQRELKLLQNFYNDDGQPKAQYQNDQRLKNLIGLVEVIKDSKDTWIIFELGGSTSAKLFYGLNGDFHNNERIYKINFQQSYYDFIQLENNLMAQFIYKVASALSLLSENKLIHCDIKPENILINYKSEGNQKFNLEQVALIDFGSVVSYHEKGTINLATIEYMPPEVINQIINENNRIKNNNHTMIQNLQGSLDTIDVWSFGASLLELLTGLPQWLSYKCRVSYKEKTVIKTGIFSIRNQDFEKLLQKQKAINEILPAYLTNILSQFDNQEKGELLLDLIIQMLKINPQERIKSHEILKHPFINSKCSQSQIDKCRANVQEMLNKEDNQNLGQLSDNPNQFKNLLNQNKENLIPQLSNYADTNNSKSRSQSLENIPDSTKYYYDKKFVIKSLNKKSFHDLSSITKNERNKSSILINQDYQIKCGENSIYSPNISIQEIEAPHIQQNQFSPQKLAN